MNSLKNFFLKQKFLFTVFLIYPTLGINAQSAINGLIIDSVNIPIPFATVALLKQNGSLIVKGEICNDKGEYIFKNIPSGNYFIKAIMVGFNETQSLFFVYDSLSGFRVPDLLLPKGIELGQVSITAFKEAIEFRDGMTVMNLENSPLASGNSVFELLKKLPGVFIDNQNNIILNGKSGVKIMIDGRVQQLSGQQLFSVLSSMSAESVSKIEVMKNPPAQYDAAGSSGMINIVSKQIKLLGASGNASGSLSKGHSYRGSLDAALNYKGKNITLFSNFGYADRTFYNTYIFNKTISLNGNTTYLNETGEQINYQRFTYYKIGADYILGERTTLGVFINGGPASTPFQDIGVNQISGYNDLGYDHTPFASHVTDVWSNPNYNINAEHKFDTSGTTLNFSGDYANFKGKRRALSENPFLDVNDNETLPANVYLSTHITDIKIVTQKLDFRKNITTTILLETGIKGTFVNSTNDYTFEKQNYQTKIFEVDSAVSNNYAYHENIIAGYINFQKQFEHASLQIGGRGENTIAEANNKTSGFKLTRNYFNFFPSITFDYPRSDNHNFQFNITRRIDRPSYKDLNPYKSYQDNYSSSIGNPYLLPQTVYNFGFTYTFKHSLYNTFTYSRYSDLILSFDFQNDTTKETTSTTRNIKGSDYYSYELFVQKKINSWWNFTFAGSVFYQNFSGTINGTAINRGALAFNSYVNNDIILPKDFKIQISLYYKGPSVYGIQYVKSLWDLNAGLKKSLLKDKLTINFSVFDIFHKSIYNMSSKFQNQNFIFINTNDTQRAWINIVYKFGGIKVQKREVNSNVQEKGRLENKLR